MIIYNGKNSFADFDLYVASKEVPPAQLKEITETVPFMSGVWDFSFCNDEQGEYEPVPIKYTFDVIADTKKDLNALKKSINKWLHSRGEQKLYDTDISTTEYYKVYNVKAAWSEDGLQGLVTVEFKCYPFMLFEKSTGAIELTTDPQPITIENEGGRVVGATFEIASKNLWSNFISNKEYANGSIVTVNADGSIYIKKVAGDLIDLRETITLPAGVYTLSNGASLNTYSTPYLQIEGLTKTLYNSGTVTNNEAVTATLILYAVSSCEYEGTIYPQFEKGTTATEYTPYIDANATIIDGVNSYALSAGKHTDVLRLKTGKNTFNISGAGLITATYTEESL